MSKLWKGFKYRYIEGIRWMIMNEGLPSMMYLATTIMILLIFCIVTPENAMQYIKTGVVNVSLLYLYSFVIRRYDMYGFLKIAQFLGAITIEFLVGYIVGSGLNFWFLAILFVVPIIIAVIAIWFEENCTSLIDFFNSKGENYFITVIISTWLPAITIASPLFFLEWSIFIKIAIVIGYILITPLICWADAEEYGVFGAFGIEW